MNNIPLERYGCLVCIEIFKTHFEALCKTLWSQDHAKVSFENHLNIEIQSFETRHFTPNNPTKSNTYPREE